LTPASAAPRPPQERTASRSFLDHVLREDKAQSIPHPLRPRVELLQDLTSSRQKLQAAIDQIHTPNFRNPAHRRQRLAVEAATAGLRGHGHGGGTLLYDSIYLASDKLMKNSRAAKPSSSSPTASTA